MVNQVSPTTAAAAIPITAVAKNWSPRHDPSLEDTLPADALGRIPDDVCSTVAAARCEGRKARRWDEIPRRPRLHARRRAAVQRPGHRQNDALDPRRRPELLQG